MPCRWFPATILLASASMAGQVKLGEPAAAGMSRDRLEAAAKLIHDEIQSQRLGAAALLVARRGGIVLDRGYGHLSSDDGSPHARPDSVFLVASITKPVTACAVMLLVERGQVKLNDP